MLHRFIVTVFQPSAPATYLTLQAATAEAASGRIQQQIDDGTLVLSADGDLCLDPETEIIDVFDLDA